ncbi:MAG: hypothetical protein IKI31_03420, partial [Treponema sp.]|nr:hypothetical protein [Treponema sp.]
MGQKSKKAKSFSFGKFLLGLILALILIICGWVLFSSFHKKSSLEVFPNSFSIFLHTDSFWESVSPLLELKATEHLLSEKPLSNYRALFMTIRSSSLRENFFIKKSLSRKIDAALFANEKGEDDFLLCVDMGFLSSVTRFAHLIVPRLEIENLFTREDANLSYFEYKMDGTTLYAKNVSNLIVASNSLNLLQKALLENHLANYSKKEKEILTQTGKDPIKIVADTKRLATQFSKGNETAEELCTLLKDNELSVISFGITENDITMKADFPFSTESSSSSLVPLLEKKSNLPAILTHLGDVVQYYTLLNAGTLEELKDAMFPIVQKKTDVRSLWSKAQTLCKTLFSESIENILFSWTGTECAVLGIEDSKDPVFVLQITDEEKRKEMFDAIFSSFALENNTNLILGGVRIPCLDLPPILRSLLSAFGVNLPRPYYFVQGKYIYFSESPQNLVSIYNAYHSKNMLSKVESWKTVSADQKASSTASMYYNLERSIPFFIKKGSAFSNVLEFYKIGRCDFRINDSSLSLQLHAIATDTSSQKLISGFPIALSSSRSDYIIHEEEGKNAQAIFWIENKRNIKSLLLDSMEVKEFNLPENGYIISAKEKCNGEGILWAVTENGGVYLLNNKLEEVGNFPIVLAIKPSAQISSIKKSCVIPSSSLLTIVSDTGSVEEIKLKGNGEVKSSATTLDDVIAVYEKSFLGEIYLLKNGAVINEDSPLEIDGIGFGSPALLKVKNDLYTSFVTQSGSFYLFKNTELVSNFPIELENIFYGNARASQNYFFALSEDAVLYRIDLNGDVLKVKIPDATSARSPFISVKNNAVYVCADSNTVYAFSENLELLRGFPVAGHGEPGIVDV